MKGGGKENIVKEEYVFLVGIKEGTKAEKEAVARPNTRFTDPEPQGPHLTFLLMRQREHRDCEFELFRF